MTTLVVGASGELGQAVTRSLAKAGHELVLHAFRHEQIVRNLADEVHCDTTVTADLRSEREIEAMVATAAAVGRLTGLAYCAGVNPSATTVANTSMADWNTTMAVNLTGAFITSREVVKTMRAQRAAAVDTEVALPHAIVLVSSIFGLSSPPNRGAYGASKHGLTGLVQSLASEEAAWLRVNAVCPGPMWTENVRRIFSQHAASVGITVEEYIQQRRAQIPSRRFLEPKECANVVTYLLGDAANFVNGECIRIAGGER